VFQWKRLVLAAGELVLHLLDLVHQLRDLGLDRLLLLLRRVQHPGHQLHHQQQSFWLLAFVVWISRLVREEEEEPLPLNELIRKQFLSDRKTKKFTFSSKLMDSNNNESKPVSQWPSNTDYR
jgi:hypothetical protein